MELVIKIPKDTYKDIIENGFIYDEDNEEVTDVIKNGTVLPKGHGRLIDADSRRIEIDEEDRWVVDLAETIIEADKAGSEDKE